MVHYTKVWYAPNREIYPFSNKQMTFSAYLRPIQREGSQKMIKRLNTGCFGDNLVAKELKHE